MTAREVVRRLVDLDCAERAGKGSHRVFVSSQGRCRTVVPMHRGDIPNGTVRAIQRQMEHCLGKDWLLR
ncbi:MAG: type II toxin-antitoxin system HicA family toxin [Deltaproteobacteria bacterium]|nr:type II toxin-antitoxin system HicA family toxin [Deltaproteobacteria bacterium]